MINDKLRTISSQFRKLIILEEFIQTSSTLLLPSVIVHCLYFGARIILNNAITLYTNVSLPSFCFFFFTSYIRMVYIKQTMSTVTTFLFWPKLSAANDNVAWINFMLLTTFLLFSSTGKLNAKWHFYYLMTCTISLLCWPYGTGYSEAYSAKFCNTFFCV